MRDGCPFCDYAGPSPILSEGAVTVAVGMGTDAVMSVPYFVIEPLNPVTEGHLLVIPREHEQDFRNVPVLLGATMQAAAQVAEEGDRFEGRALGKTPGCNLIVSAGAMATQTVPHVHVHVVPRREGDGLKLPWSE